MGVRAVIVVRDGQGRERRFWAPWASPVYQIRHLAEFIHAADTEHLPLSIVGYRAYVDTHPGTLPAQDITDAGDYSDPDATGDLDHRYLLLLDEAHGSFRYRVYERDSYPQRNGWRLGEELGSRRELNQAANRICMQLADQVSRQLASGRGLPPNWPTVADCHAQAAQFTRWLAEADPQMLDKMGPVVDAVPQWYAVRTARTLVRRINTVLRQAYPKARITTVVGTDCVVAVRVPADLATDADAARVAAMVEQVCGHPYTVTIRPHRRSRHTVHSGASTQAYATLTLRPVVAGSAAPDAPQHPASDPHRGG